MNILLKDGDQDVWSNINVRCIRTSSIIILTLYTKNNITHFQVLINNMLIRKFLIKTLTIWV